MPFSSTCEQPSCPRWLCSSWHVERKRRSIRKTSERKSNSGAGKCSVVCKMSNWNKSLAANQNISNNFLFKVHRMILAVIVFRASLYLTKNALYFAARNSGASFWLSILSQLQFDTIMTTHRKTWRDGYDVRKIVFHSNIVMALTTEFHGESTGIGCGNQMRRRMNQLKIFIFIRILSYNVLTPTTK